MQLLIDLGNSRLKWALGVAGAIARARRVRACRREHCADALEREWHELPPVRQIFVASVAPLAFDTEIEMFAQQPIRHRCRIPA